MKKILALSVLLCTASIIFLGCSSESKGTASSTSPATSVASDKKETSETSSSTAESEAKESLLAEKIAMLPELSTDMFSCQIQINNKIYQFPMSFDSWQTDWSFIGATGIDNPNYPVKPNTSNEVIRWGNKPERPDVRVELKVVNFTETEKPYTECTIAGLLIDRMTMTMQTPQTTIILPGGIIYGVTTMEEVKKIYGEAKFEDDNHLEYKQDITWKNEVTLEFHEESKVLVGIDIKDYNKPT